MPRKKPLVYIVRVEWCPYAYYMDRENERLLASFARVRNNGDGREKLSHGEMVAHLRGVDGLLVLNGAHVDEITTEAVREAGRVKVASVSHWWDQCTPMAQRLKTAGVTTLDASDPCTQSVAEWSLGAIIAGLRKFELFDRRMKNGVRWPGWRGVAGQLSGQTVGLVGVGRVGRWLLRYLRAFDCRKLAYDPFLSRKAVADMGAEKVTLEVLLKTSDAVSLHAPVVPETKGLIGRRELRWLKDGALLVNSARAWLLDNDAFRKELRTGRIRAYLDVFEPEPPELNDALRALDNVVLTPHVAGTTDLMFQRCGRFAIEALRDFFRSRRRRDGRRRVR